RKAEPVELRKCSLVVPGSPPAFESKVHLNETGRSTFADARDVSRRRLQEIAMARLGQSTLDDNERRAEATRVIKLITEEIEDHRGVDGWDALPNKDADLID